MLSHKSITRTGGKNRFKKFKSKEELIEFQRNAAKARWKNHKKKGTPKNVRKDIQGAGSKT